VKATNAYAAKRALIGRLTTLSQVVGHPLEGVQVGYARPSGITDRCVYGGKARINYVEAYGDDGDAEGQTAHEVVTTELYVRALGRGLDEEATEQTRRGLRRRHRRRVGEEPRTRPRPHLRRHHRGVADFWAVDDGTEAILALSIDIGSWLT
jgi:hypothetical protein